MRKGADSGETRELQRFKNAARGATNPRQGVSTIRARLSPETFLPAIRWLESAAPKGARVMSPSFPSNAAELHRFYPFKALPLEDQFLWAASRTLLHADKLSRFSKYLQII